MITFEISKWVLVATICGIMLLGALIELLVACIYSSRDNVKKERTDESEDKITQLENEIGLMRQSVEFLLTEYGKLPDCIEVSPGQWMRIKEETKKDPEKQCEGDYGLFINGLQEKYNSLAKKYEDVRKEQIINEKRINQLTSSLNRFKVDTSNDFHDLEEHVHEWLKWSNSKPHRKDKDPAIEFNYNLDCYAPTRNEAMRIIKNLYDKFNEQGYITVAEYRQEFDQDWLFMQEDYGWNEFDTAAVYAQYLYDGYKVIMPKPILLFGDFKEDEEQ